MLKKNLNVQIAKNYFDLGEFETSLEYCKEILDEFKENELYHKDPKELMAKISSKQKDFDYAIMHLKSALEIVDKYFKDIKKSRNKSNYLYEIGVCFLNKSEQDSALFYFNKSLESLKLNNMENTFISDLLPAKIATLKKKVFWERYLKSNDLGFLDSCATILENLISYVNNLHNSYINHESKLYLQENSIKIIEGAIEVCHELYKQTGEVKYLEEAFAYAENLKAKTLLGEMRENDALKLTGLPDSLRDQERDYRIEIAFYERQINEEKQKTAPDEEKVKMWESELFNLTNGYEDLITQIENDFPKFKRLRNYQNEIDLEQIRKQVLDEEALLLEYFVGEKQAYVFALSKNDLKMIPIDSASAIALQGEQMLSYINTPPSQNGNVSTTFQNQLDFSKDVFHKAINAFDQDFSKVIVIPDNVLSYLPFEVFLDEDAKMNNGLVAMEDYVLDDYQFSYNYSVVLLLNKMEETQNKSGTFVGYSPSFSDKMSEATRSCTSDELYSLRCSEKEITSISEILGGTTYTGTTAGKTAFVNEAANYKIIHLATHACIDEANPRFNKI
ncbi:MAG: CHAT domain-containing protein, partial [Bacteroidota bacterium]